MVVATAKTSSRTVRKVALAFVGAASLSLFGTLVDVTASHAAPASLAVTTISVKKNSTINPNTTISVSFNEALAPTMSSLATTSRTTSTSTSTSTSITSTTVASYYSGTPVLSPSVVGGTWVETSSRTFTFESTYGLVSGVRYSLRVPSGAAGPRSSTGGALSTSTTIHFSVGVGSTTALNRDLAQLRYIPLSYAVASGTKYPGGLGGASKGTWAWRFKLPKQLTTQWNASQYTVITKGAVMALENTNAMTTDGLASTAVWHVVTANLQKHILDKSPWNYVLVRQALPQQLHLYVNGKDVYDSLVNTGIPSSTSDVGTFPVYLRFTSTTMSGTNPDGSHYNDTGIPWVSYFSGGDALHGFIRSGYGWPQSLGCIEMPFANAGIVWPHTPIGTLVTVQPF